MLYGAMRLRGRKRRCGASSDGQARPILRRASARSTPDLDRFPLTRLACRTTMGRAGASAVASLPPVRRQGLSPTRATPATGPRPPPSSPSGPSASRPDRSASWSIQADGGRAFDRLGQPRPSVMTPLSRVGWAAWLHDRTLSVRYGSGPDLGTGAIERFFDGDQRDLPAANEVSRRLRTRLRTRRPEMLRISPSGQGGKSCGVVKSLDPVENPSGSVSPVGSCKTRLTRGRTRTSFFISRRWDAQPNPTPTMAATQSPGPFAPSSIRSGQGRRSLPGNHPMRLQ